MGLVLIEVSGGRVREWMDYVKLALGSGGMTVEAARQCGEDRKSGEPRCI